MLPYQIKNFSRCIMKIGHYSVMMRKTVYCQIWLQVFINCLKWKNYYFFCFFSGLGSILFAIKIDNPDHNSGLLAQKLDKMKIKTEPIIEAPVVGMLLLCLVHSSSECHKYRVIKNFHN